jgi:hypothetical protein
MLAEADKQVGEIHRFKGESIVRQAPVKLFHQLNVVARQFAFNDGVISLRRGRGGGIRQSEKREEHYGRHRHSISVLFSCDRPVFCFNYFVKLDFE